MPSWLEWVTKLWNWLQAAPTWFKLPFGIWAVLTVALAVSALFVRGSQGAEGEWPITHDPETDQAHKRLNAIRGTEPSDQALLDALRPLFLRSFYRDVRSEEWPTNLFAICRTRIALETYVSWFKAPTVRNALVSASASLSHIQGLIASAYGVAFDVKDQCSQFGFILERYRKNLPAAVDGLPNDRQIEQMNNYVRLIRAVLRPIGLVDFDPTIDNFQPTPKASPDEVMLAPVGSVPSSPDDQTFRSDSNPAPPPANIFFFNGAQSKVKVVWLTPDGLRVLYTELEAGNSYVQPTYEGHLWLLTDAQDIPLAAYRAKRGYQKVIYPPTNT